jgi:hypothetical protein
MQQTRHATTLPERKNDLNSYENTKDIIGAAMAV